MITKKLKIIFVEMIFIILFLVNSVFATELNVKTTKSYDKWDSLNPEEKEETLLPRTISVSVPKEILNKYDFTIPKKISYLVRGIMNNNNVGASITSSKYSLKDDMDLRVENQGKTYECWAFSTIKSLETNIAISNSKKSLDNFSERHMDYTLSQSFTNGKNPKGLARDVSDGGLPIAGLAYLASGKGAVLESSMPFVNSLDKIKIEDIDKKVDTIATGYSMLPIIDKTYVRDQSGNTVSVKYYNGDGIEYTSSELQAARNIIKEHIIKYGAITSMNGGNYSQFYSNPNSPFSSINYNCNDITKVRNHAVTIIGWDDNYSKNNFVNGARPSTDGAYLILNSYGSDSFDKGYMYISYEDFFIEDELYGVTSSAKVDYDNIYQYDEFGGVFEIGTSSTNKGYVGNIFTRSTSEKETLKDVGITIPNYSKINIYVNPTDSGLELNKLTKVYSGSDYLTPGYHRIDIEDITLSGNNFAIVVEQISNDGSFYFSVETLKEGTSYSNVDSEGKSYFSLDGVSWSNLNELKVDIDTNRGDVCIKGFTVLKSADDPGENPNDNPGENPGENPSDNPEENPGENPSDNTGDNPGENPSDYSGENIPISISSFEYTIDNKYIMGIEHNTSLEKFLSNINTNSETKKVFDNNTEITNSSTILRTGTKLRLSNGTEYVIIIRGDIKEDGKITLTDLSKLIAHYNEINGMELKDNQFKAADMNIDGKINLVDISQMVVLYNSI